MVESDFIKSSINIGKLCVKGRAFLAPLAGVSDSPFRFICKKFNAPFMYTEMISAKGLLYNSKNTKDLLYFSDEEKPIAIQLFGSDILAIEKAVDAVEKYPFAAIDINMGCPVAKIVKNGEGSALMKRSDLAHSIIKAVKRITDKPVSVKFRRGYDMGDDTSVEFAKIMEDAGADMITIHGRYKAQMYSGLADFTCIKNAKEAVSIPVFASGDIFSKEDAYNALKNTGCDGVMVARGALGRPWIFHEILDNLDNNYSPDIDLRRKTIMEHTRECVKRFGEYAGIRKMRSHISWYTKGLKNSAEIRRKASTVSTIEDVRKIVSCLQ